MCIRDSSWHLIDGGKDGNDAKEDDGDRDESEAGNLLNQCLRRRAVNIDDVFHEALESMLIRFSQ